MTPSTRNSMTNLNPDVAPRTLLVRRARGLVLRTLGRALAITLGLLAAVAAFWAINDWVLPRLGVDTPSWMAMATGDAAIDAAALRERGFELVPLAVLVAALVAGGVVALIALGRAIVATTGGARNLRGSVEDVSTDESQWHKSTYWMSVAGHRFRIEHDASEQLYLGQEVVVRYRPGLSDAIAVSALCPAPSRGN